MIKKISVLLIAALLIATCGTCYRVEASQSEYVYRETTDSQGNAKKAWFKNGEELSGNPGVMGEMSQVIIDTTPDSSCAEYLATFYEPTTRVTVNSGVTVTFGSESKKASIQGLTCNNANVTVYAEGGSFNGDGSLPGSVYGVTCFNSNVNFYGNIQYLCLGDEFTYGSEEYNKGNVVVNGCVYSIEYHTTSKYTQGGTVEYYRGFIGDASVSGTVGNVSVYEITHSNALGSDVKATIGNGSQLPSFKMTNGQLTPETSAYISKTESNTDEFYYEYSPMGDGRWSARARYLDGSETQYVKEVTAEEMKEVLNSGNGRVYFGGSDSISENLGAYNLAELKVQSGGITVNNVTTNGNGLLMLMSYGTDRIDVTVNGDVDRCQINFTRFNENMNLDVKGTVKNGEVYKFSLQSDTPIFLGTFSSTNMPIFVDGVWNPDLFLSLGTTEYHPVDDTLLDEALDLEKNKNQGGQNVSEMADIFIEEMGSSELGKLESDKVFKDCVDEFDNVDVITGVDIEIEKFDYNESTGVVSNKEVVSELGKDKDLSITIKVPEQEYDKNKEYIIVREHDNNGKTEMEVLVPEQDGDRLTFESNKFSKFIIVEVKDNHATVDKKPSNNNTDAPTADKNEKPSDNKTDEPTVNNTEESNGNEGTTGTTGSEESDGNKEDISGAPETSTQDGDENASSENPENDVNKGNSNNSPIGWIVGIIVVGIAAAGGFVLYKKGLIKFDKFKIK